MRMLIEKIEMVSGKENQKREHLSCLKKKCLLAFPISLEVEIELNTNLLKFPKVSSTKGQVATICGII